MKECPGTKEPPGHLRLYRQLQQERSSFGSLFSFGIRTLDGQLREGREYSRCVLCFYFSHYNQRVYPKGIGSNWGAGVGGVKRPCDKHSALFWQHQFQ